MGAKANKNKQPLDDASIMFLTESRIISAEALENSHGVMCRPGVVEQYCCPHCVKEKCRGLNTRLLEGGINSTWKVYKHFIHWQCRTCEHTAMIYYHGGNYKITRYINPLTDESFEF